MFASVSPSLTSPLLTFSIFSTLTYFFFLFFTLFLVLYIREFRFKIAVVFVIIVLQFLSLAWYTLSYIPYGREMAKTILSSLWDKICCFPFPSCNWCTIPMFSSPQPSNPVSFSSFWQLNSSNQTSASTSSASASTGSTSSFFGFSSPAASTPPTVDQPSGNLGASTSSFLSFFSSVGGGRGEDEQSLLSPLTQRGETTPGKSMAWV